MSWETVIVLAPLLLCALMCLAMIFGCAGKGSCHLPGEKMKPKDRSGV